VTFSVMGHIAKADGRVSANEIKMAQSLMSRMRLSPEQRQIAIERFQQGKADHFNFEAALNELRHACHGNIVLLRLFVELQQQAAMVDGLSEKKRLLLEQISRILGADPFFAGNFSHDFGFAGQQQTRTSAPPIANPYAVLNIESTASDAEVKRAYRRLMSQNHPDKLASQGLSEEMIKLATEKTQGIQAAYEQIRQQRGIK
jgi:DnaJ like chaperone protein